MMTHLRTATWEPLLTSFEPLWDLTNNNVTLALSMLGVVFGTLWLVSATFAIDHFDLFGVKQGTGYDVYKWFGCEISETFSKRLHLQYVRHPIYTGFFLVFFVTPLMTLNHLVFAVTGGAYIVAAVAYLEEPDLRAAHPEYAEYAKNTPAFCPMFK